MPGAGRAQPHPKSFRSTPNVTGSPLGLNPASFPMTPGTPTQRKNKNPTQKKKNKTQPCSFFSPMPSPCHPPSLGVTPQAPRPHTRSVVPIGARGAQPPMHACGWAARSPWGCFCVPVMGRSHRRARLLGQPLWRSDTPTRLGDTPLRLGDTPPPPQPGSPGHPRLGLIQRLLHSSPSGPQVVLGPSMALGAG